ncbi:MAG: hypothetical protein ABSC87_06690 [Halobacteriota archaeon]|jgi:hypothetical protein
MTTKLAAVIVLVIVALLSVAGCINLSPASSPTPIASNETVTSNNTTFSSVAGFNITYPKTLKVDINDTNASGQVKVYVYLTTNNTVDAMDVATEAVSPNATYMDYTLYNVGKITDYPNYQQITNQSATLGGKPAYTVVWQATVPVQTGTSASTVQNQTLKVMQTYVVNNNNGYVVTYKAIPSDYNTYLAQAQQIMSSFEFIS